MFFKWITYNSMPYLEDMDLQNSHSTFICHFFDQIWLIFMSSRDWKCGKRTVPAAITSSARHSRLSTSFTFSHKIHCRREARKLLINGILEPMLLWIRKSRYNLLKFSLLKMWAYSPSLSRRAIDQQFLTADELQQLRIIPGLFFNEPNDIWFIRNLN